MNEPLVSIIISVYNAEGYIEKSLQSVICQTYKNIELIIVNDGSKDNSVGVAMDFLEKKHFKNYRIINQDNAGMGKARNTGLLNSNGYWSVFLDSDDCLVYNAIERMIQTTENNDVEIVFAKYKNIYSYEECIQYSSTGETRFIDGKDLQLDFLSRKHVVLAPGTLFQRDFLIENNLLFSEMKWSEDQHFVWRVLYHVGRSAYINDALYMYYRHGNSIMSASKVNSIINSYPFIMQLKVYYADNPMLGDFIVSRWVMGTLNALTKLVSLNDWKAACDQIDGKQHFKTLRKFPQRDVQIVAYIALYLPSIYYYIIKWSRNETNHWKSNHKRR